MAVHGQRCLGGFGLSFGKQTSPTHTLVANVNELHSLAAFGDPAEFLTYVRQSAKAGTNPRRFTVRAEKIDLDPRFGPFSAVTYSEVEDRAAANARGNASLVLKVYGYVFVHAHFPNLVISIDYSERGRRDELDPAFEARAKQFIEGIRLKQP